MDSSVDTAVTPASSVRGKATWCREFPLIGKGTFVITCVRGTAFNIAVRVLDSPAEGFMKDFWIGLVVQNSCVRFLANVEGNIQRVAKAAVKHHKTPVGYEVGKRISYWLSFDRDDKVLKFGKGYRMTETTILTANFTSLCASCPRFCQLFFKSGNSKWIEQYDSMNFITAATDTERVKYRRDEVTFDPEPVTANRSPIVRDSTLANMFDIERGRYTFSADLPLPCQTLYNNVKASHMTIQTQSSSNSSDKFDLIAAIRKSLASKDGVLHKKLLEKAEISGSAFKDTYLRITIGHNLGNSPGVPYVLEIWPKGHGSPIHSHGNAYGVIRVLHGGIRVHIYNKDALTKEHMPLMSFDAKEGDITWLSPKWFQTHRLANHTDDFCATLQCYKYGEEDNIHCPYFEYISTTNEIGQFTPNSDFSFIEMCKLVMAEHKVKANKKNKKKLECLAM